MKYPSFVMAACLLWLTGCSSLPMPGAPANEGAIETQPPSSREAAASKPTTVPAYPIGELSPIQPGRTSTSGVAALATPVDLWERIRRGYAMPDLKSELVQDREQWYTARPEYIYRMTERSRKYLFHIVEELERRNMPTELALLPFVESAFNPQAVSSAKAAGMWQFMPATGKTFELKQSVFRDDRRDVLASTRAALDYLQKLYGLFGDWHLALAAYNWGEGSVGRAIAKNQKAGLQTGYLDLSMPMETRFYVPKLQAVKNIVSDPAAFNSRLPLIENHPYFESVTLTRDIDVSLAAKLAEVSLEDFKALNPSLNKPVILAAGTPQILLPWDNAAVFKRNLDSYAGTALASWTVWMAPTTLKTADAARRVGMSEDELRRLNNIPPRVMIKAGSALLVPRASGMVSNVAEHVADNGQISLAPEITLKRTVVKARKGDTVASLARRYRVTTDNVADWNKVKPTAALKPGQSVVVFLAQTSPVASAKATTAPRSVKVTKRTASTQGRAVASSNAKVKPVRVANR
ncbi:MAG: hypothetical protein RL459_2006 [Pseudomonadota bacterium]